VTLYRSPDDGDTWEKFWEDSTSRVQLLYSPDFANDTLVYLKSESDLLRSRDGGKTWETLAKGIDDGVNGFAISPTYARITRLS